MKNKTKHLSIFMDTYSKKRLNLYFLPGLLKKYKERALFAAACIIICYFINIWFFFFECMNILYNRKITAKKKLDRNNE